MSTPDPNALARPVPQDSDDMFMRIVRAALVEGIVDIFTVTSWSLCGTPSDEIVAEIAARTQAHRAAACPSL